VLLARRSKTIRKGKTESSNRLRSARAAFPDRLNLKTFDKVIKESNPHRRKRRPKSRRLIKAFQSSRKKSQAERPNFLNMPALRPKNLAQSSKEFRKDSAPRDKKNLRAELEKGNSKSLLGSEDRANGPKRSARQVKTESSRPCFRAGRTLLGKRPHHLRRPPRKHEILRPAIEEAFSSSAEPVTVGPFFPTRGWVALTLKGPCPAESLGP